MRGRRHCSSLVAAILVSRRAETLFTVGFLRCVRGLCWRGNSDEVDEFNGIVSKIRMELIDAGVEEPSNVAKLMKV